MTIAQGPSTDVRPQRDVETLRLPAGAGPGAASLPPGDSTTIDEDTRALLAAMRDIASAELADRGAAAGDLERLRTLVRGDALPLDPEALARAMLRDEGL